MLFLIASNITSSPIQPYRFRFPLPKPSSRISALLNQSQNSLPRKKRILLLESTRTS